MRSLADKLLPNPQRTDLILFPAVMLVGWVVLTTSIRTITPDAITLLAVALITAVQWVLLRRATRQPVPLPGILVLGINLIGVSGYLWYPALASRAAVSAGMPDSADVYHRAATVFATASLALWAGGMLAWSRKRTEPARSFRGQAQTALTALQQVNGRGMLFLAALPLVVMIIAYTPSGLWMRGHYSDIAGPAWAIKLGGGITSAGIALTALLASRHTGSFRLRRGARILLAAYFVVVWAVGSRSLAFIPLMLLIMLQVDPKPGRSRAASAATTAILGASSLLLLQVPLSLRGRPEGAGLQPYWHILTTDPGSLIAWSNTAGTLGNILFAVPLAAVTSLLPAFPHHYLMTSLNPLPGAYTDWAEVSRSMRINAFTPTSAIGELANYGMLYLIGFFAVFGWALARVQAWNSRLSPLRATLASIVGFGACGGLTLGLLQYNLRSGMRGAWYFLALSIVLHLLPRATSRGQTSP
jgi:hypothetical protein